MPDYWQRFKRFWRRKPITTWARGFKASEISRLFEDWKTDAGGPFSQAKDNLNIIRSRSREQVKNNPWARKFIGMCTTNIVGEGIQLNMTVRNRRGDMNKEANETIEHHWLRWARTPVWCDMAGKKTHADQQALFVTYAARDGEALVRLVNVANRNPYAFALKFYEPDVLDHEYNDKKLPNGNKIKAGIEVDSWDRPVAYHLKRDADEQGYVARGEKYVRIPAADIIHAGIEEREGQMRYLPWLTPILADLKMLAGYEEAEVVAARIAAAMGSGFYQQKTPEDFRADEEDNAGKLIQNVEPGAIPIIPMGYEHAANEPKHPTSAYADFVKAKLRGIASGLHVAYNGLANDLENVNFSSIRSGTLEERYVWQIRQQWLISHFCRRVFARWLRQSLTTGILEPLGIADYRRLLADTWQPRRWQWVDPMKDAQMNEMMVKRGWKSNAEVAAEQGRNWEDVQGALEREAAAAAESIVLPAALEQAQIIAELAKANGQGALKSAMD